MSFRIFRLKVRMVRAHIYIGIKKMKRNSIVKTVNNKTLESDNLKALIDNTNDLMWSVDSDFKLITCNRAFKEKIEIRKRQESFGHNLNASVA